MILLLDQGLPRSTIKHLAAFGISANHVGDLGLSTASDVKILQTAAESQATIVTLDADFHQILATTNAVSPSVVRIRIQGLKGVQLAAILDRVVNAITKELAAGAVASVTSSRIRVRSLPIGK